MKQEVIEKRKKVNEYGEQREKEGESMIREKQKVKRQEEKGCQVRERD